MTGLLDKTCSTNRATESKTSTGGNKRSFAANLSGVKCRRQKSSGDESGQLGGVGRSSIGVHRLWCYYGTDIIRTDQVVMDGVTYEVVDVDPDMAGAGEFMAITLLEVA